MIIEEKKRINGGSTSNQEEENALRLANELNQLFLSEEDNQDEICRKHFSGTMQGLEKKVRNTKPPNEFVRLFQDPNDISLQTSVCPKDKEQDAVISISQWLGPEYSLDKLSPIVPKELFEHVNRCHKIISRICELDPFLVGMRNLADGRVSDKQEAECPIIRDGKPELLWNFYVNTIVKRASQTLEKIYPDVNKKCLIAWLTEIARLPIRQELFYIITQMIYERNQGDSNSKIGTLEPGIILYMQLLLLNSQKEKVIYCIYDKKSCGSDYFQEERLQIHFSNGEGKDYHFFKHEVANQCAKFLDEKEFTNQAFFIDFPKAKVTLPFLLFCVLSDEGQLMLIGIQKRKENNGKKILAEALKISGIKISNYAICLEQKSVSGGIKFENPHFDGAMINLNDIRTNYITTLAGTAAKEGNFFFTEVKNTKYINAMIFAMERDVTNGNQTLKEMNGGVDS